MGDQWGITLNYYDNGALNKPVEANNANMLINLDFSYHGTSGPYGAQFAIPNNSRIYYRTWVEGSPFTDWQSIAFVTDNVASATKLQTPRYIFGQPFDGTNNVSGSLYGVEHITTTNGTVQPEWKLIGYGGAVGELARWTDRFEISSTNAISIITGTAGSSYNGLYILDNNVGIGTPTPQYKLHVNGATMIEGTLITHYADLYQTVSDNSYDKLAIQVRGNGSVNTVCPGIGFHQPGLYGGYLIMSTANDFSFYRYAGAYGNVSAGDFQSNGWFRTNGNFGWYNSTYGGGLYMEDTTYVRVYGGKSLYVPNELYVVTGISTDGYLSSKGQNTTSDMRLKTPIRTLDLPIDKIAKAPAIEFAWKDGKGIDIGSSAQYWQSVLPASVKELNNYLTLNYGGAAMVGLISVAKKVVNHEDRITALENENMELRQTISNLERRLYA